MFSLKLQEDHFFTITIGLSCASVLILCLLWVQQAQINQRQHAHLQKAALSNLTAVVVNQLRKTHLEDRAATLNQLSVIDALSIACLYLDQKLEYELSMGYLDQCPDSPQSPLAQTETKGIVVYFPFSIDDHRAGFLTVKALSTHATNYFWLIALMVTIVLSGVLIWLTASLYFKRLKSVFGLSRLHELETICNTITHQQNYLHTVPDDLPYPFTYITAAIRSMLDELLKREDVNLEYALQLQEKADQLESQKKLLVDRHQNLQKMFAGASHDLKQPLQAMTIFLSAIKETATPRQVPILHKLEQVLDNLNDMFNDLLDVSKLESRIQRIPKSDVPLDSLLIKIFDEFEAIAHAKQIELRIHPTDQSVYSNPNMLERIIRNMISNAIRYTRTGGVLIGARSRRDAVWIDVWDTGKGIPKDKLNDIFNEFVQLDSETNSEHNKGVGLGLFIVKKLAQLLDHNIVVKSRLRKGTLFRVKIAKRSIQPEAQHALPNKHSDELPELNRKQPRIMLLDDDESVRGALKHLLETWDMAVIEYASLHQSLNTLATENLQPDLIISDFQLGKEENGIEAIKLIRQQVPNTAPAILISGTQDPALLETIHASELPFLRKPVRPAKLRALINTLLQSHEQNDQSQPSNP